MRLIDADKLAEEVNDVFSDSRIAYGAMIGRQPTAYNLDKVVKELEEQAEECRKYWQNFDDGDAFGGMNAYCHAIRIVKRGGCNE